MDIGVFMGITGTFYPIHLMGVLNGEIMLMVRLIGVF